MNANVTVCIRIEELCEIARVPVETVVELVEYGIVEPGGDAPENWEFEEQAIPLVCRAARILRDFDTDLQGACLALDLMQQLDTLRQENRMLRQRLQRFMLD